MDSAGIRDSIRALPLEEQLRLLYDLWDELAEGTGEPELSPDVRAELERRYDAHLAGPDDARSWKEVSARLKGSV